MSAANFTYHIDDATCYYLHSHSNSSYHTLNDSQITRCRSGTEPPPVEDTHSFVALHCLWNETKMQSHDILSIPLPGHLRKTIIRVEIHH